VSMNEGVWATVCEAVVSADEVCRRGCGWLRVQAGKGTGSEGGRANEGVGANEGVR
jgi:hypothetical protein